MARQGKRLSKRTQARIVELHEQGVGVEDIAAEIDVVSDTVKSYIDPAFREKIKERNRIAYRRRKGLDGTGSPQKTIKIPHPIMSEILEIADTLNLTKKEIAERAGLSIGSLSQYLYRGVVPAVDKYIRLAEAVGLEVIIQRKQK